MNAIGKAGGPNLGQAEARVEPVPAREPRLVGDAVRRLPPVRRLAARRAQREVTGQAPRAARKVELARARRPRPRRRPLLLQRAVGARGRRRGLGAREADAPEARQRLALLAPAVPAAAARAAVGRRRRPAALAAAALCAPAARGGGDRACCCTAGVSFAIGCHRLGHFWVERAHAVVSAIPPAQRRRDAQAPKPQPRDTGAREGTRASRERAAKAVDREQRNTAAAAARPRSPLLALRRARPAPRHPRDLRRRRV